MAARLVVSQRAHVQVGPGLPHAGALHRPQGRGLSTRPDGGINQQTAIECAKAGADTFVSGTALFGQRQLGGAVRKMRDAVSKAAGKSAAKETVPC